jgi:hypothetical protein
MGLKETAVDSSPSIIRLAIKAIKYSKGGFDPWEKKELGEELLALALVLLEASLEDKG